MAKNPKNNGIIKTITAFFILIGIITAIIAVIAIKFWGCELKEAITTGFVGSLILLAASAGQNIGQKKLYQVGYTVNGEFVAEQIWAVNKKEVENSIYLKHYGKVVEDIIIAPVSG